MQKHRVSWEETFCSAKYPRNEKVKKKKKTKFKLFSISHGHNPDWSTLGASVGAVHAHPWTQPSQAEPAGWTMGLLRCWGRGLETLQVLGNSLVLHCKAPRELISQEQGRLTQVRPCAALRPRELTAAWREVWCLLPGLHCGCSPAGTGALLVRGSNASWWKLWAVAGRLSVASPHYGALDQKADEMEALGRWPWMKSAYGRATGWGEETVAQPLHLSSVLLRKWA